MTLFLGDERCRVLLSCAGDTFVYPKTRMVWVPGENTLTPRGKSLWRWPRGSREACSPQRAALRVLWLGRFACVQCSPLSSLGRSHSLENLLNRKQGYTRFSFQFPVSSIFALCLSGQVVALEREAKISMPRAIVQCVHALLSVRPPIPAAGQYLQRWETREQPSETHLPLGWVGTHQAWVGLYLLKQEIRLFVWDSKGQDKDPGMKHCGVGTGMDFGLV